MITAASATVVAAAESGGGFTAPGPGIFELPPLALRSFAERFPDVGVETVVAPTGAHLEALAAKIGEFYLPFGWRLQDAGRTARLTVGPWTHTQPVAATSEALGFGLAYARGEEPADPVEPIDIPAAPTVTTTGEGSRWTFRWKVEEFKEGDDLISCERVYFDSGDMLRQLTG